MNRSGNNSQYSYAELYGMAEKICYSQNNAFQRVSNSSQFIPNQSFTTQTLGTFGGVVGCNGTASQCLSMVLTITPPK